MNGKIKQRLVRLKFLAKCMTGEELACELISVLSVSFGTKPNLLAGMMRDRASINDFAVRVVSIIYNNAMSIGCFSHTLDIV